MPRRIVVIQGHPDPHAAHFGHALANAYVACAASAGHAVDVIEVAKLEFPLLHAKTDFEQAPPPPGIRKAQEAIAAADHLVIFYPLWLGTMPALLKGFFEQLFRPGFAYSSSTPRMKPLLTGKSARIVVTMGMPAFFYRWYFGAHGLKSLQRSILAFVGIKPVKTTLIGTVETAGAEQHQRWLERMRALGSAGK